MIFEEVRSHLGRRPHFDSTKYPYCHVCKSCFLEAKSLGRVTKEGLKSLSRPNNPTKADEEEIHFNAITQNSLVESLSIDVFNKVHTKFETHSKISTKAQVM